MKIAIDYDGTCTFHTFPKYSGDVPGAAEVLKELSDKGHQLILFTMRSDNKDDNVSIEAADKGNVHPVGGNYLTEAVTWFKNHNINLHGIQKDPAQSRWTSSPKCYAEMYIDDAALGCPLVYPQNGRPYVDWDIVRQFLVWKGLLV